MILTFSSIPRK